MGPVRLAIPLRAQRRRDAHVLTQPHITQCSPLQTEGGHVAASEDIWEGEIAAAGYVVRADCGLTLGHHAHHGCRVGINGRDRAHRWRR
jgi:hypothetical protein